MDTVSQCELMVQNSARLVVVPQIYLLCQYTFPRQRESIGWAGIEKRYSGKLTYTIIKDETLHGPQPRS